MSLAQSSRHQSSPSEGMLTSITSDNNINSNSLGSHSYDDCVRKKTRVKLSVNQENGKYSSRLHEAIHSKDMKQLKELIASGREDINCVDREGFTPLHTAVRAGDEIAVRILLQNKKTNVNCTSGQRDVTDSSDGLTPLHLASSYGFPSIVSLLLKCNAKVNPLDRSERTPLSLAVSKNNIQVVQTLLSFGANPNIKDIHGYSPLSLSIYSADGEMTRTLVTAGAVVDQDAFNLVAVNRRLELLQFMLNTVDSDDDPNIGFESAALTSLLTWIGNTLEDGSRFNDQMDYLTQIHDVIHSLLVKMHNLKQSLPPEAIFRFLGRGHYSINPHSDQIIILRKIFDELIDFPDVNLDCESSSFTDGRSYSLLTRCFLRHNYYFAVQLIKKGINRCDLTNYHFECLGLTALKMLFLSGPKSFPDDFETFAHPVNPLAVFDVGNNFTSWENNVQMFKQFVLWLQDKRCQPLTLKELTRIQLRRTFGQQLQTVLTQSHLPQQLILYLLFNE